MAMVEGIMYPPVLDPILPARELSKVNGANQGLKVYFQAPRLSFTSNKTLATWHMQVSLVNIKSNSSMINNILGIALVPIRLDEENGQLYVVIPQSLLRQREGDTNNGLSNTGAFLSNTPYRLQMRFDKGATPTTELTGEYLEKNYKNFSEWSTSCILRFTETPMWYILPFDKHFLSEQTQDTQKKTLTFHRGIVRFEGSVYYGANPVNQIISETDTLDYYYYSVFTENKKLIFTSEHFSPTKTNPRSINCTLDVESLLSKAGEDESNFIIKFYGKTKLGVEIKPATYFFQIAYYNDELTSVIQDAYLEIEDRVDYAEEGLVGLKAVVRNFNVPIEHICLLHFLRSSSLTDYKEWEIIKTTKILPKNNTFMYSFIDNTVQDFTTYKYKMVIEKDPPTGLAKDEGKSQFSPFVYGMITNSSEQRVQPNFEYAFLSRGDKQLPLKFDFNVSSYSQNINRNKIDTLGGKYPKFVENAEMKYKQMQVSGLISTQADDLETFLNKEDYLKFKKSDIADGTYQSDYGFYVKKNEVVPDYDYYWEREYREAVLDWLNDGEPKLFRSPTEGNVVVMISNATLQPNQTLSRRLASFSATFFEVGDGNDFATLMEKGVVNVDDYALNYYVDEEGKVHNQNSQEKEEQKVKQFYNCPYLNKNSFSSTGSSITSRYSLKDYFLQQKTNEYVGVKKTWSISPDTVSFYNMSLTFFSLPKPYIINSFGEPERVYDIYNQNVNSNSQIIYGYTFSIKNKGEDGERSVFVPAMLREEPLLGRYNMPMQDRPIKDYMANSKENLLISSGKARGAKNNTSYTADANMYENYTLATPLEKGKTYTISGTLNWLKGANNISIATLTPAKEKDFNGKIAARDVVVPLGSFAAPKNTTHFSYTFTYNGSTGAGTRFCVYWGQPGKTKNVSMNISTLKLEEGSQETPWCPNSKEINGISEKLWAAKGELRFRDMETSYYYLPDSIYQQQKEDSLNDNPSFKHLYYGFYKIPKDVEVEDIYFDFTDEDSQLVDMVACETMASFSESTVKLEENSETTVEAFIVSQASDRYTYGSNIVNDIKFKHARFIDKPDVKYATTVYWLKGISIEAEPYSVFSINYKTDDETSKSDYVVGASGRLNLMKEFKITELLASGKYLTIQPTYDKSHNIISYPSLELWEGVYAPDEEQGKETLSQIKEPRYQRIYRLKNGKEFILYGDNNYYEVVYTTKPNGLKQAFAKVPVEAVINYSADVIKKSQEKVV